jgi:hypothetical protein
VRSSRGRVLVCPLVVVCLGCAYSPVEASFQGVTAPDSGAYKNDYGYEPPVVDASAMPDVGATLPDALAPPFDSAPDPVDVAVDVGAPSACALPLSTGLPSCDSCIGQSCCAEDDTCGNDPDCLDLIMCMSECETVPPSPPSGDAGGRGLDAGAEDAGSDDAGTCLIACEERYPTGANELEQLDDCLGNSCSAACQ